LLRSHADRLLVWPLRVLGLISGAITLFILGFLILESIPALSHVGTRFFSDPSWHPAPKAAAGLFNLVPMLSGTILVAAAAILVATPLGLASALFCHFYAPPPLAAAYRRMIEVSAGIPSVVYGFWGLVVLVPLIARIRPPGTSFLAGVVILSFMILPTMALLADAAIANVPKHYLAGAAALGLSRWSTIRGVVLPAARSGLFTAVVLETGRALGETMAVLMVCGNVVRHPGSIFDPVRTLTANIALEMAYAMGDHRAALFVSGLVLMLLTIVLTATAALLSREGRHG